MSARHRRRLALVISSIVVHLAVVIAFFIGGIWKIERLDAGQLQMADFAVLDMGQPPAGGPKPKPAEALVPKEPDVKVTHDLTQRPAVTPPRPPADTTDTDTRSGSGSGSRSRRRSGSHT